MSWRNIIWVTVVVCVAGLATLLSRRQPPRIPPGDPDARDLNGVVKAYKLIRRKGYPGIEPGQACRGAIEGMVRQIDEFSIYIPPDKATAFERRTGGERIETGLRIRVEDERLMVIGPMPGSPAQKAGIFAGMEILSINGTESAYLPLDKARRLLQSSEADTVALRLRRTDGRVFTRQLAPRRMRAETVTGLLRDAGGKWRYELDSAAGVYYIRISEFLPRTPGELQEAYRRLDRPRGLVLDLRGNPGGVLPPAVEVADRFFQEGLIVATVSRDGRRQAHYAHADGTYPPVPMVVLVDEGTASAAEIVAGSLQVHGRAVLVGQVTYGKWRMQSTLDLGHGLGKIHLTTAECFLAEPAPATAPAGGVARPSTRRRQIASSATTRRGGSGQSRPGPRPGLDPDVPVRLTVAQDERLGLLRLEAMVARPAVIAATRPIRRLRLAWLKRSILETDAQLARALSLLREAAEPASRPAEMRRTSTGNGPGT